MSTLKLYKSGQDGCKFIFTNGQEVFFRDARYATSDEQEIKELDAAVKTNHMLYIDPEQTEIEEEEYLAPVKFAEKEVLKKYGIDPSMVDDKLEQVQSPAKALGAATSIDLASIIKK